MRKPFQGVWNIVRFNWHFYAGAALLLVIGVVASAFLPQPGASYVRLLCVASVVPVGASLAVSFYIYDFSNLYDFRWLEVDGEGADVEIANINAGFDETSSLLREKFPHARLTVLDFYDPSKHTEVSIRRAREAYPAFPGTLTFETERLPLDDASMDLVILFLAAHEIRNDAERATFFGELSRVLKPGGKVCVTEHLRDVPNFIAYNAGFFHFLPKRSWYNTFDEAGLAVFREMRHSPFMTTFSLRKHGSTS